MSRAAGVRCLPVVEVSEALSAFREAADLKAELATPEALDHELFGRMESAWQVLEAAGDTGRDAWRSLLQDESRYVRCWVATQLLGLGERSAAAILEADAEKGDLQAFNSAMSLKEWRHGTLQPPLGSCTT